MLLFINLFIEFICEFMKKIYNFERNLELFVFVVGKIDILFNIELFLVILWLCVFDFDMLSRNNGFMFVLEGYINIIYFCILKDCFWFFFLYIYWC